MDFTREPIVETVITPKEGHKLVVRSSKSTGQEEYFVDAVEVVSFGQALFFRSIEKPKSFLVPVSDYEVLEVREARMVLKNVGVDQSIKIGGGRETHIRAPREAEKTEAAVPAEVNGSPAEESADAPAGKKRERRRHSRRRRGPEDRDDAPKDGSAPAEGDENQEKISIPAPSEIKEGETTGAPTPLLFSALLQPPPNLISETIARYKETFKEAFFTPENETFAPHDKVQGLLEEDDDLVPSMVQVDEEEVSKEEVAAEEETASDQPNETEHEEPIEEQVGQEEDKVHSQENVEEES